MTQHSGALQPEQDAGTFPSSPPGGAPVATFHARVAGVGLVTTVVVLLAACLTFMLQQWAVARTQSSRVHTALAGLVVGSVTPALVRGEPQEASGTMEALSNASSVVVARFTDANGRVLIAYERAKPAPPEAEIEVITADALDKGRMVGRLEMRVVRPALAPLLPQFIALTAALLFGGVGAALFLARNLAHRVIAPVQKLSQAMNEVAAGGRFEPVAIEADDELFRSLTTSFNHLLGKLGEREEDLRRAMRELEGARDAANAANVLKTQFLANMSHEIRTPLNGVLAMAEVMSMGDLAQVQRERLDVIRQSGGLLLAVLNDVLDLSKIEAGKLTLSMEDFDLEPVVTGGAESFGLMARNKGLAFNLEIAEAAKGRWRGDSDRLRQILGNLLSNAVKFTASGQVRVAVDVGPRETLRIVVQDSGVGIAADKLPMLFEKFTQADNSATRRFGGTGLGLAICRELTQMMGGTISVDSREGRGSTFTVELPLERGGSAQARAGGRDAPMAEEGALRVLAAEDNPTNQQVLAAVMDSLGIEIDIVPDGAEVVEAWRTGDYDLILMDIQMPVMDGIAAAREIRAIEQAIGRRRIPIVALTANALTHQVAEYLAAGMDQHVAKPIEIAKLYEAMSSALTTAATTGEASRNPSAQVA